MTAALFVSSALLWSMKAPPMVGGVSALGAAGYIVGAYLGRHLLRTIRKTGDIDFKAGPLQGDKEHG
jgi:ubiquinone biosynthesis protein